MRITDIAKAVSHDAIQKTVGRRPGEKIHEQMIGSEDAPYTYEYEHYFKILPAINNWCSDPVRIAGGKLVASDFLYNSENNEDWMSVPELQQWLGQNLDKLGKI